MTKIQNINMTLRKWGGIYFKACVVYNNFEGYFVLSAFIVHVVTMSGCLLSCKFYYH